MSRAFVIFSTGIIPAVKDVWGSDWSSDMNKTKKCFEKHTAYQPTDEEFRCPRCGAEAGDFFTDEPVGEENCSKIHAKDFLFCSKCEYGVSGSAFSSRMLKEKNQVPCPTCKGVGTVEGRKASSKKS